MQAQPSWLRGGAQALGDGYGKVNDVASNLSVAAFVAVGMVVLDGPAARATELIPPDPRSAPLLERTEIGPELRSCSAEADDRGEFGDVIVEISRGEVARLVASKNVGRETIRCVRGAVERLLEVEHRAPRGQVAEGEISDVRIGRARPLLPASSVLVPVWERHLAAAPADVDATRKRLEAVLPPDLTVGNDRCLVPVVDGEIVRQSVSQSFRSVGREIPRVWRFLFDDRLAPDSEGPPAFLISPTLVLRTVATPTKLCLVDIGRPDVRQHLRQRMEMLGTCWVGDFAEILMAPKVAFPDDIRFRRVSVSPGGATMCGLDLDGRPHCCGRGAAKYPVPSGTFDALSLVAAGVRGFGACGIRPPPSPRAEGALECWGDLPPIPRPTRLRRFVRHSACGVTSSHEVACGWNVRLPVPEGTQGKVREASWAGSLGCVLTESARIVCSVAGKARTLDGRFRDLDVGSTSVCATDTEGRPHCWDARTLSPIAVSSSQAQLHDVLVVESGEGGEALCGIDSEAKVDCRSLAPGRAAPPTGSEGVVEIAEGGGCLCGVTKDERIRCWGDTWPALSRPNQPPVPHPERKPH